MYVIIADITEDELTIITEALAKCRASQPKAALNEHISEADMGLESHDHEPRLMLADKSASEGNGSIMKHMRRVLEAAKLLQNHRAHMIEPFRIIEKILERHRDTFPAILRSIRRDDQYLQSRFVVHDLIDDQSRNYGAKSNSHARNISRPRVQWRKQGRMR